MQVIVDELEHFVVAFAGIGADLLAVGTSGTVALAWWLEAVLVLVATVHMGVGGNQLGIDSDTDPPFGWISGEGGVSGDEAVGHEGLGEAIGALDEPSLVGVA
jgi:hypothetical protein